MPDVSFVCPDLAGSALLIEEICRVLESRVPGLRFDCTYGSERPTALKDRAEFISARLSSYRRSALEPFSLSLCNDATDKRFTGLTVWLPYPHLPDRAHTLVSVVLPNDLDEQVIGSALCGVGDASRAWHGTAQLVVEHAAEQRVSPQYRGLIPLNVEVGRGAVRRNPRISRHLIPVALQWMHYLSKETSQRMGFPQLPTDARWTAQSQPTAQGAWILRITAERLDMFREDHCLALRDAYERFRAVWVPVDSRSA